MGRYADDEDWVDDDWNAEDGDEEFDSDNEWEDGYEEEPTIDCPHCGAEIHEDSVRCPHCEQYLTQEALAGGAKPWWVIAGILLCLLLVLLWLIPW